MTFCIRWNRSSLFQPECWQQIVIVTWLSIIWQASVHNAFELIYAPTTWETPATHQPRQQRRRITNQLILFRVKVLTHINPEGIIPNTRQVDPLLVSHQVILTTVHLLACSLAQWDGRENISQPSSSIRLCGATVSVWVLTALFINNYLKKISMIWIIPRIISIRKCDDMRSLSLGAVDPSPHVSPPPPLISSLCLILLLFAVLWCLVPKAVSQDSPWRNNSSTELHWPAQNLTSSSGGTPTASGLLFCLSFFFF